MVANWSGCCVIYNPSASAQIQAFWGSRNEAWVDTFRPWARHTHASTTASVPRGTFRLKCTVMDAASARQPALHAASPMVSSSTVKMLPPWACPGGSSKAEPNQARAQMALSWSRRKYATHRRFPAVSQVRKGWPSPRSGSSVMGIQPGSGTAGGAVRFSLLKDNVLYVQRLNMSLS